ncbi:hypothetical protein R1sor_014442 [Riccia sorocarpa]|uniref:Uncharacterized protein n=1 Tax=Riccia sorocarpa TaxID=122646 RepID=A0ABD3H9X6_9MARC
MPSLLPRRRPRSKGNPFLLNKRKRCGTLVLKKVEKSKREVAHSVGLDRVKAFALAGIHNSLKIELLKVHYSDEKTREKYHHPTKFDVDNDLRPWLAQWALWSSLELLSCDIVRKIGIVRGPKEEDDDERTARLDAEVTGLDNILKIRGIHIGPRYGIL